MRGYGTILRVYSRKGTHSYTWSPPNGGPVWVGLCRDCSRELAVPSEGGPGEEQRRRLLIVACLISFITMLYLKKVEMALSCLIYRFDKVENQNNQSRFIYDSKCGKRVKDAFNLLFGKVKRSCAIVLKLYHNPFRTRTLYLTSKNHQTLTLQGSVYKFPFSFSNAIFFLRFQKYFRPHDSVFKSFSPLHTNT